MDARQKVPGPAHPITVTPTAQRVVVRLGDTVIADTTDALTLQESTYPAVQYLPAAAVDPAVLHPSDHRTYCPYKGAASHHDLGRDGELAAAVWFYPEPYDAVAPIKDHLAFYPGKVTITIG